MIIITICAIYALLIMRIKFTPVFSSLVWMSTNIFSPFISAVKKLVKRKPKQQEIIEDAFAVPVKDKKANTLAQKLADKGGDDISKIITELGKIFVDVDKRVKYFFIILFNVFFLTGTYYHIKWAINYPEVTFILLALFIEFVIWAKKTSKPKTEIK